ncbi:DNA repair protein RecN [Planktothrix serta PCC 8927]|uniref:DNA repair protein RecN n=1 Tax=Planktothrix serta PCC 8927 TaxID=671068 RepID=A0A7Z9BTK8_9CYAN|nr:DNA repair protein RecN [Planktothrix serta]VXD20902.1 DNA repair protein RecN [Planktothrix serta PCC 8927]
MLLSLRIENFALIDHLDLDLGTGLNVFTGETGAGKSIILDAVDAILGGKVDRRSIRTGATRSLLEATFEIEKKWLNWLTEQEIDLVDGSLIVCSREVVITGDKLRSRSRINGVLVNRKLIDQLRDRFIEITAQGQTLQLGQPERQQEWLDLYGGQSLIKVKKEVYSAYSQAQTCSQALEKRRQFEQQRLQRLDLLTYQIRELDAATLTTADELEQLQIEHQRLNHIVELQQQSYQIYQALYQHETGLAAADLLSQAEGKLSDLVEYDPQLQPILEIVSEAVAQITEAGRQIGSYGEQLESDPQRLEEVEDRIRDLKQICRKYGQTLEEVIEYYQRIQEELKDLEDEDQSIEFLEQTYQQAVQDLKETCEHLTTLRQKAAHQLETHLIKELKPLAMNNVKFQVEIYPISPTLTGADQIQFCFSPNPGEPIQPLGAIASGGEMSRFLLALKACFSQIAGSGTLVFDEIDVGVSGRVATAIAQKLHQLGQRHQVLCVTHQPLVAAMGDHHFRVTKEVIQTDSELNSDATDLETRTVVRVTPLTPPQRREELAQLASGESAQEAIAFAESLLTQAALMKN